MNIFRYGIAFVLTMLMVVLDINILLIGCAVALFDGIANNNWNFKACWEYIEARIGTYAEYWDIVRK